MAPECAQWITDPEDYRYGECLIQLGDAVEIELEHPSYSGGACVESVTVSATFGCMAHEASPEPDRGKSDQPGS